MLEYQTVDPGSGSPLTAWSNVNDWCILDTQFNAGQQFLATWRDWQASSQRPRVLHYVALCPDAPLSESLLSSNLQPPELACLAQQLAAQWFGLLPGLHRFLLADGQLILTLCVGDALKSLRQQSMQMDAVRFTLTSVTQAGAFDASSLWSIKALARCCKRGAKVDGHCSANTDATAVRAHLQQCGFVVAEPSAPAPADAQYTQCIALYNPSWQLKNRRNHAATALAVQRCAVIGAGLAGASVAASLARRGWQVQVLDQASMPASEASGLPVGLVVPHVSSDDCALSRLSRAGARLILQQAQRYLIRGQQWAATGVLERQVGGTPKLPAAWPVVGQDWSTSASEPMTRNFGPGLWHARGAWLKPAALIRAWLDQPGITFQGLAQVNRLHHDAGVWHLLDNHGQVLYRAERVVFANACDTARLLENLGLDYPHLVAQISHLPTLQGMRGLLNWALHDPADVTMGAFPTMPVNGSGSIVPQLPTACGTAWFMGSSYQPLSQPERCDADNQSRNFAHLQQLLPNLANALAAPFASSTLGVWKNTRCVSADRLPLVGPLDAGDNPSLWLCTAMGSRGMSFSVLCAELLAARMGAEPLPIEAKLANMLTALRA